VWRWELGAYVIHNFSCRDDHVWKGTTQYTVSIRQTSFKFRADLNTQCAKPKLIGGRSTETKCSVSFSCTQAAVLFITLA
jgi:hypothetical protein